MSEDKIQASVAYWLPFVQTFVEAYEHGARLSEGQNSRHKNYGYAPGSPLVSGQSQHKGALVLLCSPHPDDEMLTGILPLRLLREQGARVVNLAMTLGSNVARQAARWSELLAACAVVGFDCQRFMKPSDFDLKAGSEEAAGWLVVEGLADLFAQLNPSVVLFPHADDAHPVHISTNRLVAAALAMWTASCQVTVKAVETEYWSSMSAPNLLVGISAEDLALLLAALSCHRGEIVRNPYQLTLPARLMDTVRRGAELVHSTTLTTRPGFLFGELYRLSVWRHGQCQSLPVQNGWIGPGHGLDVILG